MLRLDKAQRRALGETLRQLANLVAGALVLGQFVGQRAPSFVLTVVGITGWFVLIVAGVRLAREKADG